MKQHFSSFRKVIQILCWPILVGVGQFFIVAIFSFLFMQHQMDQMKLLYPNETEPQIIERVNSLDLKEPLNHYISSHMIYVLLLNTCIILPIVMRKYYKYGVKRTNEKIKNPFLLFLSPIVFCLIFHIILIQLGAEYTSVNTSLWTLLLSQCIVGPILEEYLFRGIVYNALKEIYPIKNAIILCTLIFAFFHGNGIQILFASLLGIILVLLYEKYQDMKIPILFHVITNLVSMLIVPNLQDISNFLLLIILIVSSLIVFIFLNKFCYKEE